MPIGIEPSDEKDKEVDHSAPSPKAAANKEETARKLREASERAKKQGSGGSNDPTKGPITPATTKQPFESGPYAPDQPKKLKKQR